MQYSFDAFSPIVYPGSILCSVYSDALEAASMDIFNELNNNPEATLDDFAALLNRAWAENWDLLNPPRAGMGDAGLAAEHRRDETRIPILSMDAIAAARMQAAEEIEQRFKRPSFECGICIDTLPHDYIIRFDRCQHPYCRDCLRNYVSCALKDRQCPIPCPTCAATKASNASSALCTVSFPARNTHVSLPAVTCDMFEILGSTAAQLADFEELQLTLYSLPVQCQK